MRDYIAFAFVAFVTKIDGVERKMLDFTKVQRKLLPAAFSIRSSELADAVVPVR